MDYKQKYEQALERAKKWSLTHKLCIEDVFPELAESEGERTRKELICFLSELNELGKNTNFDRWNKANCAKWITWLEKQGKEKPNDLLENDFYIGDSYTRIKGYLGIALMHYLDNNCSEGKMCLSNMECADIDKAFDEQDWPKIERYIRKYVKGE